MSYRPVKPESFSPAARDGKNESLQAAIVRRARPILLYFVYRSNTLTRRLRGRVPTSHPIGSTLLREHRLAWHKVSTRDHSGKCDILPDPKATIWGVVFEIDPHEELLKIPAER